MALHEFRVNDRRRRTIRRRPQFVLERPGVGLNALEFRAHRFKRVAARGNRAGESRRFGARPFSE